MFSTTNPTKQSHVRGMFPIIAGQTAEFFTEPEGIPGVTIAKIIQYLKKIFIPRATPST